MDLRHQSVVAPLQSACTMLYLLISINLLILQSVQTVISEDLKIVTKTEHVFTYTGDNLTLPCTILGGNYNPFLNPVIWYKIVPSHQKPVQINTGAVINKPFEETGRYNIEPNMTLTDNPSVQMPLILSGIQLSENGTYKCELRSRDSVLSSVKHKLVVLEHVSRMTFSTNVSKYDNSSRNAIFEMEEDTPTSISCKVVGGNPIPHLRISHGRRDITDEFQFRQRIDVVGPPGLQINKYTSELYSDTFIVNEDWRGSIIKCVAKVPRRPDLRRAKSAKIEVVYRPKIFCGNDKIVSMDSRNVSLTCRIKANPSVSPTSIQWQYNALMAVTKPNNVSKQSIERDLQHHLKLNTSHINSSNTSKSDTKQGNSVKTAISNDSWTYNDNTVESILATKTVGVWKLVNGVMTGQGTEGYTINTIVNSKTGETISTLLVHNITKYVFQTYYIIAENNAGKTKHGIRIIQEGHEFLEGEDRNKCGAVKFSTVNHTLQVNTDVLNFSSEAKPCLFISHIREFFMKAPRAYFLTWPIYEILIWLFELVYPNS